MNGRLGLIQLLRSCWILEPCSYLALADNWNAGGDFGEITDCGRIMRRSDFGEITDYGRIMRRSDFGEITNYRRIVRRSDFGEITNYRRIVRRRDFGEITDCGRPGTPSLLLP